jgi:hypothetical protein
MSRTKNVIGDNMDALLTAYKSHVINITEKLVRSGLFADRRKLDEISQKFIDDLLNDTLADSKWPTALSTLTELLHILHQVRVVVLVNEYDAPTSYAMRCGFFSKVCLLPASSVEQLFTITVQANIFFRRVFASLLKVRMLDYCHTHGI